MCIRDSMYTVQDILDYIHKNFPELAKIVQVGKPGSRDEALKNSFKFNNDETKKVLGFQFIPLETTLHDSLKQIDDAKKN